MLVRHIVGGCVAENSCMSKRRKGRSICLCEVGMIKMNVKGFLWRKACRNGQKCSTSAKIFSLCGSGSVGFVFMFGFTVVIHKGKIIFYKNLTCRKCCLFLIVILLLGQIQGKVINACFYLCIL